MKNLFIAFLLSQTILPNIFAGDSVNNGREDAIVVTAKLTFKHMDAVVAGFLQDPLLRTKTRKILQTINSANADERRMGGIRPRSMKKEPHLFTDSDKVYYTSTGANIGSPLYFNITILNGLGSLDEVEKPDPTHGVWLLLAGLARHHGIDGKELDDFIRDLIRSLNLVVTDDNIARASLPLQP
jgi:hypothetical protein